MVNSWTCDGIAKDGKHYPNCSGPHAPHENYGTDCVVCGLPRSAVVFSSTRQFPWRELVAALSSLAILGLGLWALRSCSFGKKPVLTVSPTPTVPTTPTTPTPSAITYTTFAEVSNVPAGTFNYGGSTTWAPLRSEKVVGAINQAHPDFVLRYTEPQAGNKPGSGTGINMLLQGQLSFSQSSRPVKTAEFEEAKTRSITLEQIAVAIDGIAFYVNPTVYQQLQGLTVAQIQAIYKGKVTNWQEVGGPDVAITPFSRDLKAGGTVDFFHEEVLQKADFGSNVRTDVRDTTDSIRKVAATAGGIGYATISEVTGQRTIRILSLAAEEGKPFISPCDDANCQTVNQTDLGEGRYPVNRRLFVVIKRDGRLDEQAGQAYVNLLLSDEGQELVADSGFVPIR